MVRYIGNVWFDDGPWVGVEVDSSQLGKEHANLPWNDGCVDGVRYFEYGNEPILPERFSGGGRMTPSTGPAGSLASAASSTVSLRTTETNQTEVPDKPTEKNRGLFVRSSSVIYVL